MGNVWRDVEWSSKLILDRSESLFELKLFAPFVVVFLSFFGFQFLVFRDFGYIFVCFSSSIFPFLLFFKNFFLIWLQPHDLPGLLNKSFLCLPFFFFHTQFQFSSLPSLSFFSPAVKKRGVHFSMPSKNTPQCHLSSCRSIFGFEFPSFVLQFSLSFPSYLSLCFLPASICVYFWLQKTSAGRYEKRETDKTRDGLDREMALVQRRGCKFRFLKLL